MTEEQFGKYVDEFIAGRKDEIVGTLLQLLSIPSVGSQGAPGQPFGPEVDRALRFFTDKASEFGLRVKNVDGYAVHAETGEGDEMVMALTHVDVVPFGSGWTHNPLGEVEGARIYGRGAQDNKGPTVACLYALKALQSSGVPLKRRVRHVVGGNEESGFRCVRRYFEVEPQPTYGFSPDAYFPVVYAEKGTMNVRVRAVLRDDAERKRDAGEPLCFVQEISAGEAANIVPDKARAVLRLVRPGRDAEEELVRKLRESVAEVTELIDGPGPLTFEFLPGAGSVTVQASGKACHASVPWEGTNAAAGLLHLIASLGSAVEGSERIAFMARASDIYGAGLGIRCQDDITGKLSCNLGLLGAEAGEHPSVWGVYNVRYPVRISGESLREKVLRLPAPEGVTVEVVSLGKPHYTDPDSFLVRTLLRVYREESGDPSPPITIGGGTYAKVIEGGVAFGPVRPGQAETAHQPDEFIGVEDLFFLVKVYARAFFALATAGR